MKAEITTVVELFVFRNDLYGWGCLRLDRSQVLEFQLDSFPGGVVRLGGQGRAGVFIELQDVLLQVWGDLLEIILRELIQKMCVGFVGELVFAGVGEPAGIEIGVGELQIVGLHFSQKVLVIVQRAIDAGNVQVLSLTSRNLEVQCFKGAYFGNEF